MKSYRLSLPASLYWRLARLAANQELKPIDLVTTWIQDAEGHRDQMSEKPSNLKATLPHDTKRPNLSDSPSELARIRELHGQLSISQIGKEIDRPKSTVKDAIERMKKRGEL